MTRSSSKYKCFLFFFFVEEVKQFAEREIKERIEVSSEKGRGKRKDLYKKGEGERESAHFADMESSLVTNAFLLAGQRGVGGGVE